MRRVVGSSPYDGSSDRLRFVTLPFPGIGWRILVANLWATDNGNVCGWCFRATPFRFCPWSVCWPVLGHSSTLLLPIHSVLLSFYGTGFVGRGLHLLYLFALSDWNMISHCQCGCHQDLTLSNKTSNKISYLLFFEFTKNSLHIISHV